MQTNQRELDPITLLQEMERAVLMREKAQRKGGDSSSSNLWYGIGYLINGVHFVSPLKHVREVLLHTNVVAVPETHGWFKGVANSRGDLITVVDVADFLNWPAPSGGAAGRWMLINDTRLNCAIIVQEVMGLKQFRQSQTVRNKKAASSRTLSARVKPFLTGKVFRDDSNDWYELDLMKLSKDKRFVNAAVQV